jgi:hypothetical protein
MLDNPENAWRYPVLSEIGSLISDVVTDACTRWYDKGMRANALELICHLLSG